MSEEMIFIRKKMLIVVIWILFPLTNGFVAVQIHRNSIYKPDSQCSFIENKTLTNEILIESCIWECVHQHDCQTAIFFQTDRICSMFKERCEKGTIQPSFNEFTHLICYRKNHGENRSLIIDSFSLYKRSDINMFIDINNGFKQ